MARAAPADIAQHNVIVAGAAHVAYCFETLKAHLLGLPEPKIVFEDFSCPLFVTWNKSSRPGSFGLRSGGRGSWRLRGCIGTLAPRQLNVALKDYALTAALRDRRFEPINVPELPLLRCTVSLLHSFEAASCWQDWRVGVHGLIINFVCPLTFVARTATFLPEVAAAEGWDITYTIDALIRKAGHEGPVTQSLRKSLQITRYQATTHTMTYEEHAAKVAIQEAVVEADAIMSAEKGAAVAAEVAAAIPENSGSEALSPPDSPPLVALVPA